MSDMHDEVDSKKTIKGLLWFLLSFPIGGLLGSLGGYLVQHENEVKTLIHKTGFLLILFNIGFLTVLIISGLLCKNPNEKKMIGFMIIVLIFLGVPAILIPFFGTWGH